MNKYKDTEYIIKYIKKYCLAYKPIDEQGALLVVGLEDCFD